MQLSSSGLSVSLRPYHGVRAKGQAMQCIQAGLPSKLKAYPEYPGAVVRASFIVREVIEGHKIALYTTGKGKTVAQAQHSTSHPLPALRDVIAVEYVRIALARGHHKLEKTDMKSASVYANLRSFKVTAN